MTPAERTAKIAELRAEADRLESEGERNWPEKVKKGMIFQHKTGYIAMACAAPSDAITLYVVGNDHESQLGVAISHNGTFGRSRGTAAENFTYLGHARDLLAIKAPDAPDAPEPTGMELVGKVCEFSDDGVKWIHGECEEFDAEDCTWTYLEKDGAWRRFARLRREDRP